MTVSQFYNKNFYYSVTLPGDCHATLAMTSFSKHCVLHGVRRFIINCFMELSRLNVIELTNLALSVATILTRDLTVSETECLLKFLCIVRDDISLILCDKRTDKS